MREPRAIANTTGRLLAGVLAVLAVLAVGAAPALAGTYTVGTTADSSTTPCPSGTATCSLRQLILYVHVHPSPPDTIIVPAGLYTLEQGQLPIEDSMSIVGAGAGSTVIQEPVPSNRATMGDRVFDVEAVSGGPTPAVSISGVEVAGGDANPDNPVDTLSGGDVRNAGLLTLTDDWITDGFACSGGGVANIGGTVTIERSLISGNHSACGTGDSGGVENFGVSASGGTPELPGHLLIDDSTVAQNDARLVGGVFSWNGPSNTLAVTNSTIASNTAQDEGPGLSARGPGAGLGLATGTARIQNSILADNLEITAGAATPTNCAPGPGLTSQGNNVDSGTDCGLSDTTPGQNDESDTNPLLGPLQNNGGPTLTMALSPGSPALNKIPARGAGCPSTDQRGVPRPQGTGCDIGAYELQVPPICSALEARTSPGSTVTVRLSCSGTAPGPFTYTVASNPTFGTLGGLNSTDGTVTYTPRKAFSGTDRFTYDATSSGGTANPATVTIKVPSPPVPGWLNPSLSRKFGLHAHYTTILAMLASGVARGAKVDISCDGQGCRFKSHTSLASGCRNGHKCPTTINLSKLFRGWRLRAGTKLTIGVVRSGDVGKVYIFSFRPPRAPASRVTCLVPGSSTPGRGC